MGLACLLNTRRCLVQTFLLRYFKTTFVMDLYFHLHKGVNFSSAVILYQLPHFDGGGGKLLNICGIYLLISADKR